MWLEIGFPPAFSAFGDCGLSPWDQHRVRELSLGNCPLFSKEESGNVPCSMQLIAALVVRRPELRMELGEGGPAVQMGKPLLPCGGSQCTTIFLPKGLGGA